MPITLLAALALSACSATDGDTLRCSSPKGAPIRIRLLGIDAPELHRCPRHRKCAPGSGPASRATLAALIRRGRLVATQTFGHDRYGRLLALVSAGGTDLSCAQLMAGQAIYKPLWDDRLALARSCPLRRIGMTPTR